MNKEQIEQAAEEYCNGEFITPEAEIKYYVAKAFITGAEWMQEKLNNPFNEFNLKNGYRIDIIKLDYAEKGVGKLLVHPDDINKQMDLSNSNTKVEQCITLEEKVANTLSESAEPCSNCNEIIEECACMRNICIKCGNPVGNITFTICDECWNIEDNINKE